MQVPVEHQTAFAVAFRAYTRALGTQSNCNFISVASSREDAETVICLAGFCTKEDADAVENVSNVGKTQNVSGSNQLISLGTCAYCAQS